MSARDIIDLAFRSGFQVGAPSSIVAARTLRELDEAGIAVVQLPEQDEAGEYYRISIEGQEIYVEVRWITSPEDARTMAAALLRAADQLEKQLAKERGPDGGEIDWGARADAARDAQVDRENRVTP